MDTSTRQWKYLTSKPGSLYRQLFVKDRWVAARTLYGHYVSPSMPRTPAQIAVDCDVPLEAVQEAIAYCESNPPELLQDWEDEEKLLSHVQRTPHRHNGQPTQTPTAVIPASP